jgi:hypothetical protein
MGSCSGCWEYGGRVASASTSESEEAYGGGMEMRRES